MIIGQRSLEIARPDRQDSSQILEHPQVARRPEPIHGRAGGNSDGIAMHARWSATSRIHGHDSNPARLPSDRFMSTSNDWEREVTGPRRYGYNPGTMTSPSAPRRRDKRREQPEQSAHRNRCRTRLAPLGPG